MKSIPAGLARRVLAALAAGCFGSSAWAADVLVSSFTDSPDPAVRGGNVTFTITAENADADTAGNVVVSYPLPANTQFVAVADSVVAGACTHDGLTPGAVTCSYPSLRGTLAARAAPAAVRLP